jgi:hypothetical protein
MNFSLFAALASLAVAGDHAHLHPSDADLYVCLPDVQGASVASEGTAIRGLLSDPEIAQLAGEDFDLFDAITSVMIEPGDGMEALTLLYEGTKAGSVSIGGLDEMETAPSLEDLSADMMFGLLFQHEVLAVLELDSDEEAAALMSMVRSGVSALVVVDSASHETEAGQVMVTRYEGPDGDSARGFWSAEWGSYLAMGFGGGGAEGLLVRLRGGESLATTDHWARGVAAMKEEAGTAYLVHHHNLIGDPWYALALADADLPMTELMPSMLEGLFGGVIPAGASEVHGSSRIVDGVFVTELLDHGPKAKGAADLADGFLGLVHPESVGVWATKIQPETAGQAGREFIAKLLSVPDYAVASEMEYSIGVSFEDLFAPLADGVAFYMLPISGATIPRFHAVAMLDDAAAYEEAWTKLAEFLKSQGGEYVKVEDRAYRKTPIFSLKPVEQEGAEQTPNGFLEGFAGGFLNPSFTVAILPDRALFGISSSYVKREVRRILKEADEEIGLHPLAAGGAPIPAGVSYYGHLDWPVVIGGVYDTVMAFLPMIGDAASLPFDVDAMPETETITQYFSATHVWSQSGENGTYTLRRSPFGPEMGLGLVGLVGGALLGFSVQAELPQRIGRPTSAGGSPEGDLATPTEPSAESEVSAEDLAARKATRLTLQEVKLGLVIYKSETSRFPANLSDLLSPTQSYPRGFLNAVDLPVDGWGNSIEYSSGGEGPAYRLWSHGPDGENNGGEGDDIPSS